MSGVRKALAIGRVNLVRQLRDRGDLFFVLVLPTLIIVALGLQFGGTTAARVGVVVPAGDPDAAALVDAIRGPTTRASTSDPSSDEATLRSKVEHGELEAGLVIPDGFSAALRDPARARSSCATWARPAALAQGLRAPIEAAAGRVAAIATARADRAGRGRRLVDEARAAAEAGYASTPGVMVTVTRIGEPGTFAGFTQFTFGASTQLVMFTFLTSMTASLRLVLTRKLGVSRRMASTPTSPATIVAGEAIGRFGVALFQAAYIVIVTALLFGVSWGDPVAAGGDHRGVLARLGGRRHAAGRDRADRGAGVVAGRVPRAGAGRARRLHDPAAADARDDAVDRQADPPVLGADRAPVADRRRRRDRLGRARTSRC